MGSTEKGDYRVSTHYILILHEILTPIRIFTSVLDIGVSSSQAVKVLRSVHNDWRLFGEAITRWRTGKISWTVLTPLSSTSTMMVEE